MSELDIIYQPAKMSGCLLSSYHRLEKMSDDILSHTWAMVVVPPRDGIHEGDENDGATRNKNIPAHDVAIDQVCGPPDFRCWHILLIGRGTRTWE